MGSTRSLASAALAVLAVVSASALLVGCGVRQNNPYSQGREGSNWPINAYGPFPASGQNGETLVPTACGSVTARPCLRARASLGNPFHYDVNTNASQPYATAAGAGKTLAAPGAPAAHPLGYLENRDLFIFERQATLH